MAILSHAYLRVTTHRLRGYVVMFPRGRIDLDSADLFRTALARCDGDVIVDLTGVPYVGSSGFTVLAEARARLEASGHVLVLRNPQELTRRAFEAVGLGAWVDELRPVYRAAS